MGQLFTVHCVRLYIAAGGDGSLPSPVFDIHSGREGKALYRPLCSVFYSRGGDGSLPSPVFGFV